VAEAIGDATMVGNALWAWVQLDWQTFPAPTPDSIARMRTLFDLMSAQHRHDGIAVVGEMYGLAVVNNEPAEAIRVLAASVAAYREAGREDSADRLESFIAHLDEVSADMTRWSTIGDHDASADVHPGR
jgi:hypothetical protein